jgi:flagellar motor switch protein FliN/FliY
VPGDEGLLAQSEIEALFGAVAKDPPEISAAMPTSSAAPAPAAADHFGRVEVQPYRLDPIDGPDRFAEESNDVSLILDVDLSVRVELGRTRMYVEDILRLREGSVISLDKLAGDPVDIFVNGKLMARGEVLVLNDNFCVRVSEIMGDSKEAATGD